MVSRTKKSSTLDGSSEHDNSNSSTFQLKPLTRKNSHLSLNNTKGMTELDSEDFADFRSKTRSGRNALALTGSSHYHNDTSDSDSQFGGGGVDSDDSQSESTVDSDHDSDGGFSVVSQQTGAHSMNTNVGMAFRRPSASGGSLSYGPATGRFRQAGVVNRRGSTSMVARTLPLSASSQHGEPNINTTTTSLSGFTDRGTALALSRRGSTSMLPKLDNSSHQVAPAATTEKKKKKKDKEKDKSEKKSSKHHKMERSSSKRLGSKSCSTKSVDSVESKETKSLSIKKKKTRNLSSASADSQDCDTGPGATKSKKSSSGNNKEEYNHHSHIEAETQKYLEQRRKERETRLEAAKERIRLKKEEEAKAAHEQKKKSTQNDSDDSDTDGEQDDEEKAVGKSKSIKKKKKKSASTLSSSHHPNPSVPPEVRLKLAYRWYLRLGMPNQEKLKERIRKMGPACDIHESDIDLLPWISDGRRVNVKPMLTSSM